MDFQQTGNSELEQFHTPAWAAEALVEQFFADLSSSDLVLEPSCGRGPFLQAVPAHVPAIGVEIDPVLAREAETLTGRRVITGDFCSVDLPSGITAMVGNPPFELSLVERFLARAAQIVPMEGRVGFVLPAYFFQTHGTVERMRHQWAIRSEMLPRTLFPGLSKPLVFALFTRSVSRALVGFCLYDHVVQFDQLAKDAKQILSTVAPRKSSWRALIESVLTELGGSASLRAIYDAVGPKRPTSNQFWKEQIRKVLYQGGFTHTTAGEWGLPVTA
jgi:site-specific DNA-methyltransferase (adenine-specific)